MTRDQIETKARDIAYDTFCRACPKKYYNFCAKRGNGCRYAQRLYNTVLELAASFQAEIDELKKSQFKS